MFICEPPPPAPPAPPPPFVEVSAQVGLAGRSEGRLALADLNGDGRPDLVLNRRLVFLNTPDAATKSFRFAPAPTTLPDFGLTAVTAFADMDNDGKADAIVARDGDPVGAAPSAAESAAVFCRGRGDGTFDEPVVIAALKPAHVAALAVGDVNGDGRLDLYRGNWYRKYGEGVDATPGDLLVQTGTAPMPACLQRTPLPEDRFTHDEEKDAAGRPTYGAVIARLAANASARDMSVPPQIAVLNYGRRWNRLYALNKEGWEDVAPQVGFDGDAERSGKYPAWLAERAKKDKNFDRQDEKPFRANGNTFDMSVGDVNGDGLFDCFVAEIAHAWAGPSSDRSRFLIAERAETPIGVRFTSPAWANIDRIPTGDGPETRTWNQGDLFCEIVDVNNDGLLDLLLASGDYPDPPPYDERLRVFIQRAEGTPAQRRFEDCTAAYGVNLRGAAQLAVGDLDLDGDMDVVCGQSFTRFTKEMIAEEGGTPQLRVFLNNAVQRGALGTTLILKGDPAQHMSRDAIGAVVHAGKPVAQLTGPGGHSGKGRALQVHFGGTTAATQFTVPAGVMFTAHSAP